jgi:hypothetical protein
MRCDFKSMSECGCPVGSCQQQPTTPAPVVQASTTTILATAIMLGAIAAFFAFVSIPRAADAYYRQALDQQENVSHG